MLTTFTIFYNVFGTCTVAASSGDEGHGKAGVNVIHTGGFVQRRIRAAFLFIGAFVVVHHQLFYLHKALDDGNQPQVYLRHL